MTPDFQKFGWGDPSVENPAEMARREYDLIGDRFESFYIANPSGSTEGKTSRLWETNRKVIGDDRPNVPQETGDCVSRGMMNCIEYLQCQEILAGDREEFRPVFSPYLYGTGRVYIGRGQLRGGAGSLGSWQAEAVKKYGVLRTDYAGVPSYSGRVADQWGDSDQPWKRFVDEGDDHLVRSAAKINDLDDLRDALINLYPCTIASMQAFKMQPSSDGYHHPDPSEEWPHQMAIVGYSDDARKPWVGILNSWGDIHGTVIDWETGEAWPAGMLRVHPDIVAKMIRTGECFAVSRFDGYPDQTSEREYMLI